MTAIELAYRKAEIEQAWAKTPNLPNTYNHFAHNLTDKLVRDLMDGGMSYENARKAIIPGA